MTSIVPRILVLAALLAACGDKQPDAGKTPTQSNTPTPQQKGSDHGASADLGVLTVAGKQFGVLRLGDLVAGRESAFELQPKGMDASQIASLNAYLWVESQDGTQLSAPEKGSVAGSTLHFHCTPRKDATTPFRVVLRLRSGSSDERGSLPLDGHGHEHVEGPHHGIPAKWKGGNLSGHLELKLHDDKGDLELWLAEDPAFQKPFDLPLDSKIEIEFVDVKGKKVTLAPRNKAKNEDEDGKANVRDGKTNYFIFQGQGEDAAWLQGTTFQSIVVVRFARGAETFASEELVLKPHVH